MKRCPECRRDYYDDSLLYCLDDGTTLLDGPATLEPETVTLRTNSSPGEAPTKIFGDAETLAFGRPDRTSIHQLSHRKLLIIILVGLLIVTSLGVGGYWLYGLRTENQVSSIAVMPFVNDSGNPDIEYLSDGMTETLISTLSQLPQLSVRARSSVFRFKGTSSDIHQIAKELNVGAILNGKVSQHGQDLSLYAELIDISSDKVIWSKTYRRSMSNFVTLQAEMAHDVLQGMQTRLSGSDEQKVARKYTVSSDAYKLYLEGRYHWNKRNPVAIGKAIDYFEQAIAIDPNYALAYSGLADCYAVDSSPAKREERDSKLRAAATKALTIDSSLGEPHAALANAFWNAHDWTAAENEFRTAIELNPNYATAHQWYGEMLTRLGRHDEAIDQITRGRDLEPLSLVINSDMIYILSMARRYDESIAQAKRTFELDPNWTPAHDELASTYIFKGMFEESMAEEDILLEHSDMDPEINALAKQEVQAAREAFRKSGPKGYWTKRLELETKNAGRNPRSAFFLAEINANLGNKDEAFRYLEKAIEESDGAEMIKVYPGFDPLRDDPRFAETVKKAGLPS